MSLRLALAALLALLIRLVFLRWTQRTDWDGFFYLWYADSLLQGKFLGVSPLWAPYPFGYPLAIAAVSLKGLTPEAAAHIVSLLAGTLTILPVFRLADHYGGRTAAWFSVMLAAFSPWLILYSVSVLSESLFTLILAALFWLWTLDFEGRLPARSQPLLWLLSLAAVFTRPVAGGAVAGIALISLALHRSTAKYLSIAVLVSILYAVYSSSVARHLQEITKGVQHAPRFAQETTRGAPPSYAMQEMSFGLAERYGAPVGASYRPGMPAGQFLKTYGRLLVRRQIDTWLQLLSDGIPGGDHSCGLIPFCLWPFVFYGAYFSVRKGSGLPLFAAAVYICSVALFEYSIRYYAPLIPIWLSFGAVGVAVGLAKEGMRRVRWFVMAGLILLSAAQAYYLNPHRIISGDTSREIGGWLRAQHAGVVVAMHPAPAYYSGARLEWVNEKVLDELADRSEKLQLEPPSNNGFVVIGEPDARRLRLPRNLELAFATAGTFPSRLYAYRVKGD